MSDVSIPFELPVSPMLAKPVSLLAEEPDSIYEPKWDGFRAIIVRNYDVEIYSRSGKSLTRYFPELIPKIKAHLKHGMVVDSEIIIKEENSLSWDKLSERIHPAQSRIDKLSIETPASIVVFDILACDGDNLMDKTLSQRLEYRNRITPNEDNDFYVTETTNSCLTAKDWFPKFEPIGLDGVMIKNLNSTYLCGKRGWNKYKYRRTADCVIIGYRLSDKKPNQLGSILLGLYDNGDLIPVGGVVSISAKLNQQIKEKLEKIATGVGIGNVNRWKDENSAQYISVHPELVIEATYDYMQNKRFRHAVGFHRFREDKTPAECLFEQVEQNFPEHANIKDFMVG